MKKISRRRFLQITGISAAAVGLNACGGSSGSTAGTAASGSASAAPAADGKKYTLRASSNQAAHKHHRHGAGKVCGACQRKECRSDQSNGKLRF